MRPHGGLRSQCEAGASIERELAWLFRRDPSLSNDFAPALQISSHPLRKRGGRPWLGLRAVALKTFDNFGIAQYLIERPIEAMNDGGGRATGCEQPIPLLDIQPWYPQFRERRYFGQSPKPLRPCHCQCA